MRTMGGASRLRVVVSQNLCGLFGHQHMYERQVTRRSASQGDSSYVHQQVLQLELQTGGDSISLSVCVRARVDPLCRVLSMILPAQISGERASSQHSGDDVRVTVTRAERSCSSCP